VTTIREHAEAYLAMRRQLGFKLTTFGQRLLSFVGWLETNDMPYLTTDAAVAWATSTPRSHDEVHHSRRLMVVRVFARHLAMLDPANEVPPADILAHHYRRVTPHLFTPEQITRLLAAADGLTPPLLAANWRTLIGLLVVTGLRVGEACRLDRDDVDLHEGILTIRDSKFDKSRQVPIDATTMVALRGYARIRDRYCPQPATPGFFASTRGTRLDEHNLSKIFARLVAAADIPLTPGCRRARLADFRHTFATTTLLDWYQQGVNVQARIPWLSTYLGHVDPKSTFWYLTGTPQLLALAAARLDHTLAGRA
jgi:Site-specific recombinase XerD